MFLAGDMQIMVKFKAIILEHIEVRHRHVRKRIRKRNRWENADFFIEESEIVVDSIFCE